MSRARRTSGPARILSIITRLGDGGSDQRLYDILAALDDVEHHVIVGGASSDEKVAALSERHRVTVYPLLVRSVDPRRDAATAVRLHRDLRADRYDAVITHQSKAGLIGRVVARTAHVPSVYHSASMASFGPGYGRVESLAFAIAERLTAPLVDRYFVVGQDLIDRLARNGVRPSRLELVRSSIDTRPFVEARAAGRGAARDRFGLSHTATVVCVVGRLDERKGAPRLADLLRDLGTRVDETLQVLVAGRGPCEDEVRSRVAELGLEQRVQFLGHTDLVPEVLAASNLILLPSSAEGLPQVLAQAAFTGTPFASFDIDGARELLALGAEGTIAPLGDDGVLVAHAAAMLRSVPRESPPLAPSILAQWDSTTVRQQYRAALGREPAPSPPGART